MKHQRPPLVGPATRRDARDGTSRVVQAREHMTEAWPTLAAPRVERPAIHGLLDEVVNRRVCLVRAAAGWGKTTALAAWADGNHTAWLTLGADDVQLGAFAHRLLLALKPYVRLPIEAVDPDAGDDELLLRSLPMTVCSWIDAQLSGDLVLVIDDLQELPPACTTARVVAGLCQHPSNALHVVLVSRNDPPFSLARLWGRGLVAEINAAQLAFDAAEVAVLLQATVGGDPPGLAARLQAATAGWPAVTRLAVEMLRGVDPVQRPRLVEHMCRLNGPLRGFLAEEVLNREPERVREFLRWLAVVGEVSLPVGRDLGFDDAENLLPDLARRGLVQFAAEREESYQLIWPLGDFFGWQLALAPGDQAALHRQAADLFARRESYADALRHLVAAADHAAVVSLLVEHGTALVNTGEISAVLAAAELPPAYLDDPRVQRILGHAWQIRGQLAAARDCFERAREGQEDLPPALAWRMALIPCACGEFSHALATYARARLDREDTADEAHVLAWAASACRMTGDYDRCRELARRSRAAADRCHDPSARAASLAAVGTLAAAQGDWHAMDACLVAALEAAETANDNIQAPRIRLLRALHLVEFGQLREALTEAETALRVGERYGYAHVCAIALTHRAAAKVPLGRLDEALADFAIARDLLTDMGSRLAAWPLNGIGDVHRRRGQLNLAHAAYEEALALAEPHHETFGMASALNGLARTRAADDIETARALAEWSVELGEGLRHVQALLTRGWVALSAGDRASAATDAALAAAAARARRDNPGLAEALELAVLVAPDAAGSPVKLDEAVQIWHEAGYPVEEAQARLVAARLYGRGAGTAADVARSTLREHHVRIDGRQGAGPLAEMATVAPSLSICALGAFQVIRDGTPIPTTAWQSKKARDLLKILVARRRPIPRELVIELLWPEEDPIRARNRLSVLLSTVRGVFRPGRHRMDGGPVASDGSAVWLDLKQVDLDVERFLAAAAVALDAHSLGQHDATAQLAAAEGQYTGDFLEDEPYSDWAAPARDEVRATYISVVRALAWRLREAGDTDGAVRCILRLLREDNYDEHAHLDLVRTLVDAGRLGEAQRRYQAYVRQMSEIGVKPQQSPLTGPDESSS